MATRQRRKSYLTPLIVPVIAITFCGYFAWHGWHGSFGVEARRELDVQADRLAAELADLRKDKSVIEHRVQLLRAQGLDSDMLDERARDILGFAQANDLAVMPVAETAALPVAQPKLISRKQVN